MPWGAGTSTSNSRPPNPSIGSGGIWVSGGTESDERPVRVGHAERPNGRRAAARPAYVEQDSDLSEAPDPEVVATLKELQRTDPVAREQWGMYCEAQGNGIRDPNKHPSEFVQTFVAEFHAGIRQEPTSLAGCSLGDFVKEGQRKSAFWKQAWSIYCQVHGGGINDPSKHDSKFIVGFLDFLGQKAVAAFNPVLGNGSAAPGAIKDAAERPAKKLRLPGGMPAFTLGLGLPAGGGSGDEEKDELVKRVKAYQRSGDTEKRTWWDYCDEHAGGIRDPAKQDKELLETFLTMNAIS
eukprot:CAMPEP_0175252924 /NCGR_PEP_ID=MMETSP0093-20121207/36423_1 /TAXON_ID=311494 /ORGANISM="Alexandrium monilatum, Strain CCMP3105" /LENGTH=293 /DNA_ID=CAMNT_0016547223 /DNA_START=77 /DNA_END=958 /DNA_ORIENTATION=-